MFSKLIINGDKLKYRSIAIANVLWFFKDDKSLSWDIISNFTNVTFIKLKEKIIYSHIGELYVENQDSRSGLYSFKVKLIHIFYSKPKITLI